MERKYIGTFIILLGLAILAVIIYFVFIHDFSPKISTNQIESQNTRAPANNLGGSGLPANNTASNQPVTAKKIELTPAKVDIGEESLKQMAGSFAERFGSFSNQSNFENISDLKVFMSNKMARWADSYIVEMAAKREQTDIYYGISTTAVEKDVKSYSDSLGKVEILVKTQRREATGATSNFIVKYENILIIFLKENDAWKVDSAEWQK